MRCTFTYTYIGSNINQLFSYLPRGGQYFIEGVSNMVLLGCVGLSKGETPTPILRIPLDPANQLNYYWQMRTKLFLQTKVINSAYFGGFFIPLSHKGADVICECPHTMMAQALVHASQYGDSTTYLLYQFMVGSISIN